MSELANIYFTKDQQTQIIDWMQKFIETERVEDYLNGICVNCEMSTTITIHNYVKAFTGSTYPISGQSNYFNDAIYKYIGEELKRRKVLAQRIIDDINKRD